MYKALSGNINLVKFFKRCYRFFKQQFELVQVCCSNFLRACQFYQVVCWFLLIRFLFRFFFIL
jgi:hypothetical protein